MERYKIMTFLKGVWTGHFLPTLKLHNSQAFELFLYRFAPNTGYGIKFWLEANPYERHIESDLEYPKEMPE